jgi:hypothetical protein
VSTITKQNRRGALAKMNMLAIELQRLSEIVGVESSSYRIPLAEYIRDNWYRVDEERQP